MRVLGSSGEDITANVVRMTHVVPRLLGDHTLIIRGEILCPRSSLSHMGAANARNAASGVARRTDGIGSEHLVVLAYHVIAPQTSTGKTPAWESKLQMMQWLRSHGFRTPAVHSAMTIEDVCLMFL